MDKETFAKSWRERQLKKIAEQRDANSASVAFGLLGCYGSLLRDISDDLICSHALDTLPYFYIGTDKITSEKFLELIKESKDINAFYRALGRFCCGASWLPHTKHEISFGVESEGVLSCMNETHVRIGTFSACKDHEVALRDWVAQH